MQDAGDDAQLVLQQVTAGGGSLTFRSSTAAADLGGNSGSGSSSITVSRGSSDCTSFDFPVLLDGSSKHGNISARLLLPKVGLTLRLQDPILVHVPLLISLVTTSINVSSDYKPFKLGVSLSKPAPSGGASVQLILGEQGAAKVCTCSCVLHSLQCTGLQGEQQHACRTLDACTHQAVALISNQQPSFCRVPAGYASVRSKHGTFGQQLLCCSAGHTQADWHRLAAAPCGRRPVQDSSYHSVTVDYDAFSLSCRWSRTLCSGQRGLQEGATSH